MQNEQLVNKLKQEGTLKTPRIIKSFVKTDRADFVPAESRKDAYCDCALPIGYNATISQPTTVAIMLELLQPKAEDIILDVGSGSGWTTAILANIVGKGGKVYGVELVPELVKFGKENLNKYKLKNAQILQADPNKIGLPDKSPYDKILVSATAQGLPQELINQLKAGGRMVIPIGSSIWEIDKRPDGGLNKQEIPGFAFVPLKT